MTEKLMHALLSPACYPHTTSNIRLLETHISWVLLTGEIAYKIKKPVNFGFLDFSSLAKRKYFCAEELRLNSRFSKGLYLDVVAICGSEDKPLVAAGNAEANTGTVLEYAVKMREFSQQGLLVTLAANKALGIDDIKSLGKKLAEFHNNLAAPPAKAMQELGTVQSIAGAARENFQQILPVLPTDSARQELAVLQQWTEQQLVILQNLFARRRDEGFVRECHGDLHLGNITRIDGEIVFFDCIEFNPQFRWIDIQSELAFVLMDLEEKQLPALANRLLNTWLEYSGDYQGLALLQFYKVYRAMVRAKVTVLKINGAALARDESGRAWQEYATYTRLALAYCEKPKPFLGIMHGISGTGKSTVAATLAAECNAIRIRSDVERKRLFGITADARTSPAQMPELYNEAVSGQTFAVLEQLANSLLTMGYPVLVDATFIAEKWRRPFRLLAQSQHVPFVIIDCQASPTTIRQRLEHRQTQPNSTSDADINVMFSQLNKLEPFTMEEQQHILAIDTEQAVNAWGLRQYLKLTMRGRP
jgi:aminoglycoside phosphotransferase family enzyme/predicted kinase